MVTAIIDRHVNAWWQTKFVIGADDCAFAVRAILAETGATQIYANRVGEMKTADAIDQHIADETGGRGLVALMVRIAADHGWKRIHPGEAADGDLVILRDPTTKQPVIGIARGSRVLTRSDPGVVAMPLSWASVAYRVIHGA